jgi:hypothetical protein
VCSIDEEDMGYANVVDMVGIPMEGSQSQEDEVKDG